MPTVTVWLTAYNHESFIGESIESVLNQSYQDFELVIIDDCSPDGTWDVICEYARKDARIKPIRHKRNCNDENCSLEMHSDVIEGDYIAIAHSDDTWHPDKLAKQVAYMEGAPDVAACFTWAQFIDDDGNPIETAGSSIFDRENLSRHEWLRVLFLGGNHLCHPSILIRRNAYWEYDLFTRGFISLPDYVKWIKLCLHADVHVIGEKLVNFRVHPDLSNTSADTVQNRSRSALETYLALHEFEAIDDEAELFKVFPEGAAYKRGEGQLVAYLLARIALDLGTTQAHWLYGLDRIHALLQDESTRARLREQYGYTVLDFDRDKRNHPVFHTEGLFCTCGMYLSFGDGFAEENCFRQVVAQSEGGLFEAKWSLDDCCNGRKPVAIRVDPDEGRLRLFRNFSACCDGKEIGATLESPFVELDSGWKLCLSLDPMFLVSSTPESGVLSVVFEARSPGQADLQRIAELLSSKGKSSRFTLGGLFGR